MTESKEAASQEILGGFDFGKTHVYDRKTKQLKDKNPYRRFVIKGQAVVEWPIGSGNAWYEDRKFAGRVELGEKGAREFRKGAKHKEWTAPLTGDQKLAREVATTKQESARLAAELAAIKAELAVATKSAPSSKGANRA